MIEPHRRTSAHCGPTQPALNTIARLHINHTLLLVLMCFALTSCEEPQTMLGSSRSSVVLVTIDTLRADKTGPYQVGSKATPNIARLAVEGTLFEAAMSPMQMTRPSHYSLFTSLYPRDHGVVNNKISLGPEFKTLAEHFSANGYATAGFVGVSLLGPNSGAERGFDHFDFPRKSRTRPAEEIVTAATQWLNNRDTSRPYFLWVHLFDPHTPYGPPADFVPKAKDPATAGIDELSVETIIAMAKRNRGDLPRAVVDRAVELYEGDIEYADHWLGRLLETIDTPRADDPNPVRAKQETVIALTADHGECFEKGIYFEHSDCLYEGAARIPLIIRYPRRVAQGLRRSDVVEILDVAPTLLSLVDLPVPDTYQGRDLFDSNAPAKNAAFLQHPLYSNDGAANRKQRRLRSVMGKPTREIVTGEELLGIRTSKWKYLRRGEHEELYNLTTDPNERRNVAAQHANVSQELREQLDAWATDHPIHNTGVEMINDELRATLEALGYLH